jgi:hypothetical protein
LGITTNSVYLARDDADEDAQRQTRKINLVGLNRRTQAVAIRGLKETLALCAGAITRTLPQCTPQTLMLRVKTATANRSRAAVRANKSNAPALLVDKSATLPPPQAKCS